MKWYVYYLADPRKVNEKKYIGCSTRLRARVSEHSNRPTNKAVCDWLGGLRQISIVPTIAVISEHDDKDEAFAEEARQIALHPGLLNAQHKDLHQNVKRLELSITPESACREIERVKLEAVKTMLEACNGNKLATAQRLGIGRQTLYNWLAKLKDPA